MFQPVARLIIDRLCKIECLPSPFSVVELGNQRFGAGSDHPSTPDYYRYKGASKYTAIDMNTKMGAVIRDLNKPVRGIKPADLVTNIGTSEHVFNQAQVFTTIHKLCKTGGIMFHILPFTPWINHGFYNYNPILFRDLIVANHYGLVANLISNRWGFEIFDLDPADYKEKNPIELITKVKKLIELEANTKRASGAEPQLIYVLRKEKSSDFVFPIQGKYQQNAANLLA